jgi:major membrane immunogen (membrane-anchored lipoprotein)
MVARQDPEKLDNVTGATQSVDAYYYAVKEALKEAAKPAQ